jgi:hypothetical protein
MEPHWEMLDFGPRVWWWVLVLLVIGWALKAESPGFQVFGQLSATDTEREEQMVALGQSVILIVRDKAIFDRQIAPLIGANVELTLVAK